MISEIFFSYTFILLLLEIVYLFTRTKVIDRVNLSVVDNDHNKKVLKGMFDEIKNDVNIYTIISIITLVWLFIGLFTSCRILFIVLIFVEFSPVIRSFTKIPETLLLFRIDSVFKIICLIVILYFHFFNFVI